MIKDLEFSDLVKLESSALFPLENINMKNCPIKKSVYSDDMLLGIVLAHSTLEISLVLDKDLSNYTKGKTIQSIFNYLRDTISDMGYDDAHIFLTDTYYEKILRDHFGFESVIGSPLVIRRR